MPKQIVWTPPVHEPRLKEVKPVTILVTAVSAAGNYHIFFETILLKQTMRGLRR